MKRKPIFTGAVALFAALLLAAGCLLASCGTDGRTESEREHVSSAAVSSEGTSAEAASSEASSEASNDPDALTPLPEDLPGMDSPAMPADVRCYLPSGGYLENKGLDTPPLTVTFTYGKDTMVVEETGDNGYSHRIEYRFDDRARLTEENGSFKNGSIYSNRYTYDEAGRMTSWTNVRRVFDEQVTERWGYVYGEDGTMLREEYTLTDAAGETSYANCEYLRTYDASGALTQMVQRLDNGHTIEHLYKDGLERVNRYCDENGEPSNANYYDYDENGRLLRERHLLATADNGSVTSYFYEGDLPAEIRREERGKVFALYRYAYDADGRLLVEFGNDWSDSYDVCSYDERGSLCKVTGYRPMEEGGYETMKHCEVTAWGDKAETEMQLAFYRVAMAQLFGGSDTLGKQFYTVRLPEP